MSVRPNRVRSALQKQRQKQIQNKLSENELVLIQMNSAEFVDYYISSQVNQGKTKIEAVDQISSILSKTGKEPKAWEQHKEKLKTAIGFIPVALDYKSLGELASEMKTRGGAFSKFKIKVYRGESTIIFKAYPSMLKHLNGTKFMALNPKIISVGVGYLAADAAIKSGMVVSLIVSLCYHVVEQVFDDEATWHDFLAGFSVDMAITGIGAAIGYGLLATTVGAAAAATVGPLIVVCVVGTFFVVAMSFFVDTKPWVEKLAKSLEQMEFDVKNGMLKIDYQLGRVKEYKDIDFIGYIHQLFGIPYNVMGRHNARR